jgi:hypothetical protein
MQPILLDRFRDILIEQGAAASRTEGTLLFSDARDAVFYVPFEHVNTAATLVLVGITPGPNQIDEAYAAVQSRLRGGLPDDMVLRKAKEVGAFSGPAMRPNLVRMLDALSFPTILGVPSSTALWKKGADRLHATSVVPHAAFRRGKPFAGSFADVLSSPIFRRSFEQDFLPSLAALSRSALFVALGPTPLDALDWCVAQGHLQAHQVMGALAHPSSNGGSQVRVYLGEIHGKDLSLNDPVRHRVPWLEKASDRMRSACRVRMRRNIAP